MNNGKIINFWKDVWVPDNHSGRLINSDIYNQVNEIMVADFFENDSSWNVDKLVIACLSVDFAVICNIPIWATRELINDIGSSMRKAYSLKNLVT